MFVWLGCWAWVAVGSLWSVGCTWWKVWSRSYGRTSGQASTRNTASLLCCADAGIFLQFHAWVTNQCIISDCLLCCSRKYIPPSQSFFCCEPLPPSDFPVTKCMVGEGGVDVFWNYTAYLIIKFYVYLWAWQSSGLRQTFYSYLELSSLTQGLCYHVVSFEKKLICSTLSLCSQL